LTEYKGTKGGKVRNYSEDPDNPFVGQVWYNENLGDLRIRKTNIGSAWSTAAPLNTSRSSYNQSGAGTKTAALVFGGFAPSVPGPTGATESYNGTSWTELNDMTTARRDMTGAGRLNTAALAFSGETPVLSTVANTEDWNGTSWTEVNDLNSARRLGAGNGTNTAALMISGFPTALGGVVESWNGTSWSEIADLNEARYALGSAGTQTAALGFGGNPSPSVTANTESWNGTSWTEVNDLNTASARSGFGLSNAYCIGTAANTADTELWNGSVWTEVNDMNDIRNSQANAGSADAAISAGGGGTNFAEEWNANVASSRVYRIL